MSVIVDIASIVLFIPQLRLASLYHKYYASL